MTHQHVVQRIALCSWSLHPTDPDDLIAQLRDLDMKFIQLAFDQVRDDPAWADAKVKLDDAGVTVVSGMFGAVGEDYSTLDSIRRSGGMVPDATWDENWRNIQGLVPVMQQFDIKLITFHAGFLPDDKNAPTFATLLQRIGQIADLCAEQGVELGFETGQESAETLKQFLDELGRPGVGVNFDPANMILYAKGDPVQAARILGPSLKQIHLKDAVPAKTPGSWGKEVPVGTGAVDWPAFFTTLNELGYAGNMVIEREAGDQRIPDIRQAIVFLNHTYLSTI